MITAILARSDNGIIGIEGPSGPALPWRLPPDLKRFRELTTGHAVIMGRKTFDSIGKPLPNRTNIVLTRGLPKGCLLESQGDSTHFAATPEVALELAESFDSNPFIIGGADTYAAFWPQVDRIEVTEVHTVVGLGVAMSLDRSAWRETFRSEEQQHDGLRFHFVTLERTKEATRG